ncbi:LacI family DNA-binding transcriptional regulator [Phytohabitans sp. ZYX-F-186]|uniref:LacI family DNA-binding transcriptional regulator n=1 Tax=Phytohabitans maris TaxID=3071409 RepID=A0ABU0ZC54_9ACTN|nr:LacI family DNA-binding transcriptional regulator [Phytohabitans sp. ZYX-F-186]MDQ7904639.1 LacI family DNA-binding transcriptional regulator [Phytohabitans sp. ZYX-F-186]
MAMTVQKPVTSADVARLAGVSQPTVSRALRGEPGVAAATIEKVRRAADALGYVLNETGRSLSTRRTNLVGIVVPELTNPFYPELIEPLRRELDGAGYRSVLIADPGESGFNVVRDLLNGSLAGVLLTTSPMGSNLPQVLKDRRIPYVLVNRVLDLVEADMCSTDNAAGARLAASLIVEIGHRRIAAVLGPGDASNARDRERGFREELAEHGIALPASRALHGPFSYESGHERAVQLLSSTRRPTSVFCANDVLAIGAYNAARSLGLRVPEDLTIVGFDDIAMASWDVFQLTTVRYELPTMAAESVRMLLARIEDPKRSHESLMIPTTLVKRATHGPPSTG